MKGILSLYPEAQIATLEKLGIYRPVIRREDYLTKKRREALEQREARYKEIHKLLLKSGGERSTTWVAERMGITVVAAANYMPIMEQRGLVKSRIVPYHKKVFAHPVYKAVKQGE
jgi:hypothetical protein